MTTETGRRCAVSCRAFQVQGIGCDPRVSPKLAPNLVPPWQKLAALRQLVAPVGPAHLSALVSGFLTLLNCDSQASLVTLCMWEGIPDIGTNYAKLKSVIEDLYAYYTETWTHRDGVNDFELLGKRFWEDSKAGQLLLWLEAVSFESENKVLRQIVDMALMTPSFWSAGPLPGTSGSRW